MATPKLTRKQKFFVKEYLVDLNASAAARRAGYSPKSAFRMGQENMQKPAVLGALQSQLNEKYKNWISHLIEFLMNMQDVLSTKYQIILTTMAC